MNKYDYIGLAIITSFAVFIGSSLEYIPYKSKVVEIGGCNRDYCGVRLANGAIASDRDPVLGEEITYDYEIRWKR